MPELHPTSMAHGGEAVARVDGKAHFVAGAMPGEVIDAVLVEDRGSWARARLVSVLEPAPERRTPPCPHAEDCGGCQWQFTDRTVQAEWKRDTVEAQFRHLGRFDDPPVTEIATPGPDLEYRNRMDFHVVDGRPGLMRPRSNDVVPLDVCLLLDPLLGPVFERLGDLDGADRITLRCGTNSGDIIVIVTGAIPDQASEWGVPVLARRGKRLERVFGDPSLTEIVGGVEFTIPFGGFFQSNTHGAEALVEIVGREAEIRSSDVLLDGYCGVGLFGATVGAAADFVVGIDSDSTAVEFARMNLTRANVEHALVAGSVTTDIERVDAYWDVAIVDPPRKGLGVRGVEAVTSSMPRRIVYVSCDPASLARDARELTEMGYELVRATPVDLFPQTYHVETVARFDRLPFPSD